MVQYDAFQPSYLEYPSSKECVKYKMIYFPTMFVAHAPVGILASYPFALVLWTAQAVLLLEMSKTINGAVWLLNVENCLPGLKDCFPLILRPFASLSTVGTYWNHWPFLCKLSKLVRGVDPCFQGSLVIFYVVSILKPKMCCTAIGHQNVTQLQSKTCVCVGGRND